MQKIYLSIRHFVCDAKRKPLISSLKECLINLRFSNDGLTDISDLTIISSNCFAGRIMQDLKIKYNSPTLGPYFMYPDYIEFLSNLRFCLTEAKIEFKKHSKYPVGHQKRATWSHRYPIGLLNNKVEIHFSHYHSEKEEYEEWYRPTSRVNFNRLLIIGLQQNLCTENDIYDFDKLPFENRFIFQITILIQKVMSICLSLKTLRALETHI